MAFDIAEYIRKRKSGQTDSRQEEETQEEKRNQQQSGGFDVGEYIRQRKNGNRESTDRESGLRDQVGSWQSGVINTGKQVYDYLSGEGYKSPNEALAAQVDQYLSQGDEFLSMIRTNRGAFGDYKTALQDYANTRKYLEALKSGMQDRNAFYSQFADEADYTFWKEHSTVENRRQWYADQQERLGELEAEKEALYAEWDALDPNMYGGVGTTEFHAAKQDFENRAKAIADEISAVETDIRNYERGNYNENGRHYGSKTVDDYYDYTQLPDFAAVSGNREFGNPTRDELAMYDAMRDSSTWYYDENDVLRDVYGNEIAKDAAGKLVNPHAQQYEVKDRLGIYLNATDEEREEYEGTIVNGTWGSIMGAAMDGSWDQLTEDEVGIYYYLLKTDGQEAADKYLDDMKTELNRRETVANQKKNTQLYEEANWLGKVGLNLATVPANFFSGIAGGAENLSYMIRGEDINPYSGAHAGSHFSNTIRSETAADLDETGIKIPGLEFTLGDAYQSGMSILDSAAAIGLGGKLGGVLLATNAANSEAIRLYEQGATKEQIAWGSAAAGAAELVFESVSIEKLITMKDAKTVGQFVKNILIQGGIEASEEGLTEIANTITNAIIMGNESDWAKLVEECGGDEKQALLEMVRKVAHSGFSGFLSGAGSAGTVSAVQGVSHIMENRAQNNAVGGAVLATPGGLAALKEQGKAADSRRANRLADKVSEADTGKNRRNIGKLYNEVLTATRQQTRDSIASALKENGFGKKDAADTTDAVLAKRNGAQLSAHQQTLLSRLQKNREAMERVDQILGNTREATQQKNSSAVADAETDPVRQEATAEAQKAEVDAYTVDETAVGVKQIAKAENGSLVLELENGETVKAEDAVYTSEGEAQIYDAVASLGVNAEIGNLMVGAYRENTGGVAAEDFALGMIDAFQFGQYNIPQSELAQSQFTSKLTPKQRNTAYVLGQTFGGKQVATAEAKARRARMAGLFDRARNADAKAGKSAATGKVQFMEGKQTARKQAVRRKGVVKGYGVKVADINKAFNPSQQQAYKVLTTIADVTGIDIVLFRSVPNKEGKLVGSVIDGIDFRDAQGAFSWHNDKIYIDINAGVQFETSMGDIQKYTMLRTFAHEFTHFIEKHNPEGYNALREMVFEEMSNRGENVDDLIEENRNLGTDQELSFDDAAREVVAEAMTDILQDSKFVEQLARKQPNMFKELLSKLREFLNRIKEYFDSVTANGTREARLLKEATEVGVHYIESIVQSFDKAAVQAVENYQSGKTAQKNTVPEDAGVKYQIREIGNTGKFYVQADRQVLTGDDASLWGKQIENYINEQIRKEQDIAIPTADGHVLLLTSRSAYKLKDNHVASIQKKVEAVLSDDAYALKGRAATHIDELIQVARFKGYEPDMNQKHENDIGEDGFNYFEAYFRDLDGKYYLVRFSAALNAQEETVYSIGQIRQRSFPADAGSSSKQEALKNGRKASTDIIYTTEQKSQEKKTAILLAYEKALRKKNTDSGTAQNQRRRESLTNRDILAQAEQLVGEQFLTVQHRNVLEIYNGRLDEVKKLELRKREQENKLQKQQSEKTPASEIVKTKNRIKVLAGSIDRNLERLKLMEDTQYLKEILTEAQTALEKRQIAESKAKLEEYRSKYGTIPAGEKAVRSDSLPKSTDGINKVSQTARTVKGAGVTTDDFADLIDVEVAGGGLTYLPITNSDTTQKAIEYISEEGWEAARYKWHDDVRAGKASAEMSAIGALLLNNAAKAGDRKVWLEILTDYQIMGTRAAQSVQALRILKTLAPTDKLYMLRRSVTNMVKDLKLEAEVAIDPALEEEFRTAETDEQRDAVITKIQKNVARQLPSTGLEMWTALRYINMLGNFKTQIRNILGNTSMAITNKLKNAIAVGLESLVYKASGGNLKRTKALTVDHDLLVACRNDFAEVEALALDGGKYADAMTSRLEKGIRDQKVIFKAPAAVKNPKVKKVLDVVLKPIEGYRKLTNTAMEKGDLLFSRNAYARALAGYLEANGVKNTDLSKVDENLLDEARAYAIKEAQEVTFRDHNALTEILASKKTGGKWQAVANAIGQGIMPFRQTPANVLLRAEEYSPLGVINTISLLLEAAAGKTSLVNHKGALGKVARAGQNVTGAQIIDSFAKTFTGTGLFVLGMIFANLGWAAGGSDDDEKKKKFDELNGRQNYALVFGDTSWTFDWLAPVAIPFFMGVNLQVRITEDGISADSVKEALLSLTEPMLQMSMLQGLNDTLDELRYSDNSLLELGVNALTDYVLQGTTNTLLAQLERSFESSRQATYTDKNEWISTDFQYTLGKTSAKIPGWDYGQIPYINAWGEEEENPPLLTNLLYNLLSPGYYSKDTTDAVTMELYRLDKVQDDNVFPSRPGKTYTQDGGEHYLSAEEYVALARTQGQTQRKLLEDMLNSRYYEGLDDGQKAKAIGYVYKYAKEFARGEVIEGYTNAYGCFSSKWMYEIKGDVAEAILRKVATGTTEKYTGLDVDTAAHVTEILQAIKPEAGYTNVRPIQRMETVMGDRTLTAAEKETALREIMPDSLTEKLDSARKIGISAEVFVKAYRKYQDTSGEGKKKTVIGYYAGTFGLSKAKSEELYDLFAGNK